MLLCLLVCIFPRFVCGVRVFLFVFRVFPTYHMLQCYMGTHKKWGIWDIGYRIFDFVLQSDWLTDGVNWIHIQTKIYMDKWEHKNCSCGLVSYIGSESIRGGWPSDNILVCTWVTETHGDWRVKRKQWMDRYLLLLLSSLSRKRCRKERVTQSPVLNRIDSLLPFGAFYWVLHQITQTSFYEQTLLG